MWWFIYGDPVGPYTFRHFVNGKPVGGLQPVSKDDNLHTALRMTENNGKTINWRYGDVYHFEANHYAPAERARYVTPVNQCLITPR